MGPKKAKKTKKQLEEEKSNHFAPILIFGLYRETWGREKDCGGDREKEEGIRGALEKDDGWED